MKEQNLLAPVIFEVGDALDLRFEDGYFNVVTSGYMLRNVTDIQRTIDEMYRVLRTGGRAVVAELSKPDNRFVRFFYDLYMNHRVYWLGKKYGGGKKINGKYPAYEWLTSSIEGFPHGKEMADKFTKAGFSEARFFVKSFGAVNIYLGIK
jgi:demethylmenaquinone methyltransferase/2-methoxy-6-polyprenyl-1,4-benzoquinol methylase